MLFDSFMACSRKGDVCQIGAAWAFPDCFVVLHSRLFFAVVSILGALCVKDRIQRKVAERFKALELGVLAGCHFVVGRSHHGKGLVAEVDVPK